jgi:hypothetical protein
LIYIDPPFGTGSDFSQKYRVDGEGIRLASVNEQSDFEKEASIIEEITYRDTWGAGLDSYLEMIFPRLILILTVPSSCLVSGLKNPMRGGGCFHILPPSSRFDFQTVPFVLRQVLPAYIPSEANR